MNVLQVPCCRYEDKRVVDISVLQMVTVIKIPVVDETLLIVLPVLTMRAVDGTVLRALDKRKYLMITFLISHQNHVL